MRYIREFFRFLKHIAENRALLLTLIKNDFRKQYLGSYFGTVWAFLQPLSFMFVIWFVFEVGFRAAPATGGVPFFLWLMAGMIPWFFFANAASAGANAVFANAFLVKKVAFRVSILPLVPIGSTFIIHLGLVTVLLIAFLLYGFSPSVYWLQLPYYMLCLVLLLLGVSWLTSALKVFIPDVSYFITVMLQLGFWFTPIFWSADKVSQKYLYILKLNPMFYIVEGYRNTFINHVWFWETYKTTPYFLGVTLFFFVTGAIVFKRLRPHFGDVL